MREITGIEDIQQLVESGFTRWSDYGDVKAVYQGDLVLLSYTDKAQHAGRWNAFERMCRGLILNKHGMIVARPFDKFFNWGERGATTDAPITHVFEKVDGSLGISYFQSGVAHIATRGQFADGVHAKVATRMLHEQYPFFARALPYDTTALFEIVYPDNRVVVDYHGARRLTLLALRRNRTGEYREWGEVKEFAKYLGMPTPREYGYQDIRAVQESARGLSVNEEGYVVLCADGQRFKVKGDAYLAAHRMMEHASYGHVVRAIREGTYDSMLAALPHYHRQVTTWKLEIDAEIEALTQRTLRAYRDAPKDTQKAFALWVQYHHTELAPYLFAHHDGKPIKPIMLRAIAKKKEES